MENHSNLVEKEHTKAERIESWLRSSRFPISSIQPGSGFDDLKPLKQILQDVKIVGLGEATHGTREFFLFKHRMLEFLVKEMGFTDFAIESSSSAGEAINEYLQTGAGDPGSLLSKQGLICWDTEEFLEMLLWIRAYNADVAEAKKIQFHGVDIWRNDLNRSKVIDFLGRAAPEKVAGAILLLDALADQEKKWPLKLDDEAHKTMIGLYSSLQDFLEEIDHQHEKYINRTSLAEFNQMLHALQVMKQWLIHNTPEVQSLLHYDYKPRSQYMAENLIRLVEQGQPDRKFIYWAHNGHISKIDERPHVIRAGFTLREKYGEQYFGFGLFLQQGTFQTRTKAPDGKSQQLKPWVIPPTAEESFCWYLTQASPDPYLLNLRGPIPDPIVRDWLCTPQVFAQGNWVTNEGDKNQVERIPYENYDGIVFFKETTAVHPTKSAVFHCEQDLVGYF